jgi:hypothetical protein
MFSLNSKMQANEGSFLEFLLDGLGYLNSLDVRGHKNTQ